METAKEDRGWSRENELPSDLWYNAPAEHADAMVGTPNGMTIDSKDFEVVDDDDNGEDVNATPALLPMPPIKIKMEDPRASGFPPTLLRSNNNNGIYKHSVSLNIHHATPRRNVAVINKIAEIASVENTTKFQRYQELKERPYATFRFRRRRER